MLFVTRFAGSPNYFGLQKIASRGKDKIEIWRRISCKLSNVTVDDACWCARVADAGRCDVVADIARSYPIPIICALLGASRYSLSESSGIRSRSSAELVAMRLAMSIMLYVRLKLAFGGARAPLLH